MMKNTVSIVILSYNRPELLSRSIEAAVRQTHSPYEIIVVDNKSPASGRIESLIKNFPNVRLVANQGNLGFAGGMNRGIADAQGHYLLLTEDDIELKEDCLARFVNYHDTHPNAGLLSGIIRDKQSGDIASAGWDFELTATYRRKDYGIGGSADATFPEPFEVKGVAGALMFMRRSLLGQLGGFRKDFFMYYEDDELCARISRQGLPIVIVPQAGAVHAAPTKPLVPELQFVHDRNLLSLYFLHAPLRVLPLFGLRQVTAITARRAFLQGHPWSALRLWMWFLLKGPVLLLERAKIDFAQNP